MSWLTSSTRVCVTMIAGNTGIAPGTASARGNTTSEFRVPELKAIARPAGASRWKNRLISHPINGETAAKVIYIGTVIHTASIASSNCGTTAAITTNRTSAVAGTGNNPNLDNTQTPVLV